MKGLLFAVITTMLMMTSYAISAQEMAVRRGVVTALQPVAAQSSAVSASTKRQLGGMIGRALLRAVGDSRYGYEAVNIGSSIASDIAASGEQQRSEGSYVVMIRFTDGSETAITFKSEQLRGIQVGSQVKVVGTGSSAMITAG